MKKEEIMYVLKRCRDKNISNNDFKYPSKKGTIVEAHDWKPTNERGNGLHGWTKGLDTFFDSDLSGNFVIIAVNKKDGWVELGDKVKFRKGKIVMNTPDFSMAHKFMLSKYPEMILNWSTSNQGSFSTSNQGSESTSNQGSFSTSNQGYNSTSNQGYNSTSNQGGSSTSNQRYNSTSNQGYNSTSNQGGSSTSNQRYRSTSNQGSESTSNQGSESTSNQGSFSTSNQGDSSTSNQRGGSTSNQGDRSTSNQGNHSTSNQGSFSTSNQRDRSTCNQGNHSTSNQGYHSTSNQGNWSTSNQGSESTSNQGRESTSNQGDSSTSNQRGGSTSNQGDRSTCTVMGGSGIYRNSSKLGCCVLFFGNKMKIIKAIPHTSLYIDNMKVRHKYTSTPEKITNLLKHEIMVFGSNLNGNHSGGLAKMCNDKWGAKDGVGEGATGQCYAFPTLDKNMKQVSKKNFTLSIDKLIKHANENTRSVFFVTKLGCGIAGFKEEEVKEFWRKRNDVSANIILPKGWRNTDSE